MDKLVMSYAPHIRSKRTTKALMLDVVIALMPALIAGIYYVDTNVEYQNAHLDYFKKEN